MALDDEIADIQAVNLRLKAEGVMLRAMDAAFDEIFGPKAPAEAGFEPEAAVDKDGGVAAEVVSTLRRL